MLLWEVTSSAETERRSRSNGIFDNWRGAQHACTSSQGICTSAFTLQNWDIPLYLVCFAPNYTTCPSCEGEACTWVEFNTYTENIRVLRPHTEIFSWQDTLHSVGAACGTRTMPRPPKVSSVQLIRETWGNKGTRETQGEQEKYKGTYGNKGNTKIWTFSINTILLSLVLLGNRQFEQSQPILFPCKLPWEATYMC